MTFTQFDKNSSGPSPAARLHTQYAQLSDGRSRVGDWKQLLQRGISFEECQQVINYIRNNRAGNIPASITVARCFKDFQTFASEDPVACKIEVSRESMDLWERICQTGCDIDPEYVEAASRLYREYLSRTYNDDGYLYAHLVPVGDFVFSWFTELSRYGSPRVRRFHENHPKFVEHIKRLRRFAERG